MATNKDNPYHHMSASSSVHINKLYGYKQVVELTKVDNLFAFNPTFHSVVCLRDQFHFEGKDKHIACRSVLNDIILR